VDGGLFDIPSGVVFWVIWVSVGRGDWLFEGKWDGGKSTALAMLTYVILDFILSYESILPLVNLPIRIIYSRVDISIKNFSRFNMYVLVRSVDYV